MNFLGRALPLLNNLIPAGLAVKGLSKIDNRLGSFVQNSLLAGYTSENVIDYLRDRFTPEGQKSEKSRLENRESKGLLSSQEQNALSKNRTEDKLGSTIGSGIGLATGLGGLVNNSEEKNIPSSVGGGNQPEHQNNFNSKQMLSSYPELFKYLDELITKGVSISNATWAAKNHPKLSEMINSLEQNTGRGFKDIIQELFGKQPPQNPLLDQQNRNTGQGNQALLSAIDKLMKL